MVTLVAGNQQPCGLLQNKHYDINHCTKLIEYPIQNITRNLPLIEGIWVAVKKLYQNLLELIL